MIDTEEWITITEFALRRHLSERQARRVVSGLPEEDRTAPEVRPAKVRWRPAMSGVMSEECAINAPNEPDSKAIAPDLDAIGQKSVSEVSGDVRRDVQYEVLASMLEVLKEQLHAKDRQIEQLQAQVENEQKLRAMEMQSRPPALIAPPRRNWIQNLIASWNDTKVDQ